MRVFTIRITRSVVVVALIIQICRIVIRLSSNFHFSKDENLTVSRKNPNILEYHVLPKANLNVLGAIYRYEFSFSPAVELVSIIFLNCGLKRVCNCSSFPIIYSL